MRLNVHLLVACPNDSGNLGLTSCLLCPALYIRYYTQYTCCDSYKARTPYTSTGALEMTLLARTILAVTGHAPWELIHIVD
jgi:hypothetical protein